MASRLRTRFSGMEPSPGMLTLVSRRISELERLDPRIVACAIQVKLDGSHDPSQRMHSVWLAIEIRGSAEGATWQMLVPRRHENPYRAIIDCFGSARAQIATNGSAPVLVQEEHPKSAARRTRPTSPGDGTWPSEAAPGEPHPAWDQGLRRLVGHRG